MDSSQPVPPPQTATDRQAPTAVDIDTEEPFESLDASLDEVLADLPEQIERLADLDPAAAAEPGAAIADLLSRALEEEER